MWGWMITVVAAAVLVALFLFLRLRAQGKKGRIVRLSRYRKAMGGKQDHGEGRRPCSICHRPATRLSFYADETGRAIGVCDRCRPLAEKRELLRL